MNQDARSLPAAEWQEPLCGVCGEETTSEGSLFVCYDCGLSFEPERDLAAEFIDSETAVCAAPCDNKWHGDNKITFGFGFQCFPCALPAGHSGVHWSGCTPIALELGAHVCVACPVCGRFGPCDCPEVKP